MNKKVLVIGSGGREHALAWKLAQSKHVSKVYCAPGNDGMKNVAEIVDINFTDVDKLAEFAKKNSIDLTVVGQEAASEAGVVDKFHKLGLKIFGPTKAAVKIESSKAFSKDLMKNQNIPTAEFENFNDPAKAIEYLEGRSYPQVIKADGLATGKGVVIAETFKQAKEAIENIMVKKVFGVSGDKIVIEDFLKGSEVSIHVLSDGENFEIFPVSQDHKQIFDNDKGPNTGGMGVIAPIDAIDNELINKIKQTVAKPALDGLEDLDAKFNGCLYPGLMIDNKNIKVLEFNARFGDPEAEVYMRLIESDFFEILESCADGNLKQIVWKSGYAISVVLASAGYPESSHKGDIINGIEEAEKLKDIVLFHAGTAEKDGNYVTAGGRVLNVTATGETLNDAIEKVYKAVSLINFEGMQYRSDIGQRLN